jgi:spore coat protein U-like protein
MRGPLIAAAAIAASLIGAAPASAAQCDLETTSVVFGSYNVFATAPVDSTGTVRLNCNGGAKSVRVSISRGQGGSYAPRSLRRAAESLGYNFFLDAGRSTVWGDGTGGSSAYLAGNPPNNKDVDVTIYGRIFAGQDISAGAYSDSVAVTIDF